MYKLMWLGLGVVFAAGPSLAQSANAGDTPFATTSRLSSDTLAEITGRDDTALEVRAQNNATVSRNSVSGESNTGTINFGQDAFGALSGLSLLSANTGNNVAINSSLNVNVSIRP